MLSVVCWRHFGIHRPCCEGRDRRKFLGSWVVEGWSVHEGLHAGDRIEIGSVSSFRVESKISFFTHKLVCNRRHCGRWKRNWTLRSATVISLGPTHRHQANSKEQVIKYLKVQTVRRQQPMVPKWPSLCQTGTSDHDSYCCGWVWRGMGRIKYFSVCAHTKVRSGMLEE